MDVLCALYLCSIVEDCAGRKESIECDRSMTVLVLITLVQHYLEGPATMVITNILYTYGWVSG